MIAHEQGFSSAPEPTCAEVSRLIDATNWTLELDSNGLQVYSGRPGGAPVVGYRTVTEHRVPAREMAAFLGAGLLDAFSVLNDRFAFGDVLREEPLVVRTGFTMPPGMRNREFVHGLAQQDYADGTSVIAYTPVDDSDLAPPRDGFLRCRIYPSGQRISALAPDRCRVEHLMTYELGGRIPLWAQNSLFHGGHIRAYKAEWTALVHHFAS